MKSARLYASSIDSLSFAYMAKTITSIFRNFFCSIFTKWSSREYTKKRWIIEKLLFYFSVNSHLLLFFFLFLLWRLVVHSWGKWMCHDDAIICNYSFPPVILMIVCFSIFLSRESNLRSSWNVYAGIVK